MRIEVSQSEIKVRGGFIVPQIMDAFDQFPYYIITGGKLELYNILKDLKELNGEENSYVDFYYELLSNPEQERVKESLPMEGKLLLNQFLLEGENIHLEGENFYSEDENFHLEGKNNQKPLYFQLTDDMLKLAVELSTSESLFSTFYFCKYSMIVWSNYGNRHPVFYKDEKIMISLQKQGIVFNKQVL
ncbi:hypothetical protein [Lachnoclostridium sp.]|uniref:hypothetical protein n=1 Tax=Lachnoclostridium sp. TaxID=2028282 RepID=UPI00289F7564|nr:hypothetical protein [Lachnoclostridium sp.]